MGGSAGKPQHLIQHRTDLVHDIFE
jgi:hypothetical protein